MGNWDTSDFSLLHAQMQQVIAFISYVSGEPFDRVSTSLRGKKSMGWMGKNRDSVRAPYNAAQYSLDSD